VKDIDLVSFVDYDSNLNDLYANQMDCIVQPVEQLGQIAAEEILARIEKPEAPIVERTLTSTYHPYDSNSAWSSMR